MEKKTQLFSIGEVAALFHLSVSSLRHYEEQGLLRPEWVDPATGYRYYSTRQFEVLNTIRYLRALDMPLAEIADFFRDRNPAAMEAKLQRQKEAVIAKQQALQRIEKKIDNRLRGLQDAEASVLGDIRLRTAELCRIAWRSDKLKIRGFLDMEAPIRKLEGNQPEPLIFLGKVGVGITAEHLQAGRVDRYDGIFLVLDEEDRYEGEVRTLPASPCVTVRFRGSHPEAPEQYRRLLAWMEEHRLQAAGFSREITMIDYGLTEDPEKFVTEISIPVRTAN